MMPGMLTWSLPSAKAMRGLLKTLGPGYARIGRTAGVDGKWVHRYATQRNKTGGRDGDFESEDLTNLQKLRSSVEYEAEVEEGRKGTSQEHLSAP